MFPFLAALHDKFFLSTYTHECFRRVSHPGASEEAQGVEGILAAYSAALHGVTLAGPTLFSEVLQTAMARASSSESNQINQRYDVLLILTDGIINDMREVHCIGLFSRLL